MLMQALGQPHADVTELLSRLRGPWALMYWHAGSGTLWFGRDCIGKIASNADENMWKSMPHVSSRIAF